MSLKVLMHLAVDGKTEGDVCSGLEVMMSYCVQPEDEAMAVRE
jgi:hypothetical protein